MRTFEETEKSFAIESHIRGRQFEDLVKWWLGNSPEFGTEIANVWLWDEWPDRDGPDFGIDLVAETTDAELWAVQAKCINPYASLTKGAVDSFLVAAGTSQFSKEILITTTDRVSSQLQRVLKNRSTQLVTRRDLVQSRVPWPLLSEVSREAAISGNGSGKSSDQSPQPDYVWESMFEILSAFVRDGGSCDISADFESDETQLGRWVAVQRHRKRNGRLVGSQIERLEELDGWTWNPLDDAWESKFTALQRYARLHGHSSPKTKEVFEGVRIGEWAQSQRTAYKVDSMPSLRILKLEGLPEWSWGNTQAAKWNEAFSLLKQFCEREGTSVVAPSVVEDGFPLGRWVQNQRQMFKQGRLTEPRRTKLEALPGWFWDGHEANWYLNLELVRGHGISGGRVAIGSDHQDAARLQTWLRRQKVAYKDGSLDPERHRLIGELLKMPEAGVS